MQDSPTRAEALFSDAAEYDDDYDTLSASMNGMTSNWVDGTKDALPKFFAQPGVSSTYRGANDEDSEYEGSSRPKQGDCSSQDRFDPAWGSLLNGHVHSAAEYEDPVRDNWESLVDGDTPAQDG